MGVAILDKWYYERSEIRKHFPALERLSLIDERAHHRPWKYDMAHTFNYALVTDYKIQQAYNKRFPKHTNDFFKNPFKRYLDNTSWFPGRDFPIFAQGTRLNRLLYYDTNYPGVVPIGRDFIMKLQRSRLTFEETDECSPPSSGWGEDEVEDDIITEGQTPLDIRWVLMWRGNKVTDQGISEASENGVSRYHDPDVIRDASRQYLEAFHEFKDFVGTTRWPENAAGE